MTISAMVGRPGAGKSYVLTRVALKALRRGQPVFANFSIEGVPRFKLDEMADLPPGVVIVDEAQNWFHARMWSSMPPDMLERWSQTRKAGWRVFIGTQHENNLDSVIRRVCQWAWLLEPRWSVVTGFERPLYIYGRRWDFFDFRRMDRGHRPLERRRWWFRTSIANAYDTMEVTRLRGRGRA